MTPARRILLARALAVIADGVQLGLLPFFAPGWLSIANDVLDVAVAVAMFTLVGWHWAFLPAFFAELLPGFTLVPTWTMAVLLATGKGGPILPGEAPTTLPADAKPASPDDAQPASSADAKTAAPEELERKQ